MLMQYTGKLGAGWRLKTAPSKRRSRQPSFPGLVELTSATAVYARDVEVYGEGEPSEYFYMVVSGAVRTYKMLADGRRQICAFHLRGNFFGLEVDQEHALSAEDDRQFENPADQAKCADGAGVSMIRRLPGASGR